MQGFPGQGPKEQPNEDQQILRELERVYKRFAESDARLYEALLRAYKRQTAEQEERVFREIQRVYQPTKEQEQTILREIRRSYEDPSPAQVARIFRAIHQAERLPLGSLDDDTQEEMPSRSFRRFDRSDDDQLSTNEMSDLLRAEYALWDSNHDGTINRNEYRAFFQSRLQSLIARVALEASQPGGEQRPTVYRAGQLPAGLPSWFTQIDTDGDAQLGLYEWRKSGKPLNEFNTMDRNGDGFFTIAEALRYMAQKGGDPNRGGSSSRSGDSRRDSSGRR